MADLTIARVRVRWHGNKSPKYNGVKFDSIVEEDRAGLCVGRTVRVHWGQRIWTGEVLEVSEEPTLLAQALPLTRARTTTQRLEFSAAQPISGMYIHVRKYTLVYINSLCTSLYVEEVCIYVACLLSVYRLRCIVQ